jgi:hypothetical protein
MVKRIFHAEPVVYGISIVLSGTVLLLVLLPFYLGGLPWFSERELIRPNRAITYEADQEVRSHDPVEKQIDARWYPLYGPEGRESAMAGWGLGACGLWTIVGFPLVAFLLWRLVRGWRHWSRRQRLLRLGVLAPVLLTLILVVVWWDGLTTWWLLDLLRTD